ncbi:MAG: DsbA family protein [Pseudomonadota bacterium]|nr:DsbA family protein [Pseudomonadota bacterium]
MRPVFAAALAALPLLAACQQADDAVFGQRVRAYLLEHPEVLEEAIRKLDENRAAQATAAQTKALAANRQALERDPRDPVIGNPDGAVTVVEFFDYRCGYCKAVAPELIDLVQREGDVRLVLKEFPILPDAGTGRIGVSERAARLALAAEAAGKYLPVHRALMAERALDDEAIARIARAHGLDPAPAAPGVDAHLAAVQQLAQEVGATGTPHFIVGGRTISGADLDGLRAAIAAARSKPAKT